MKTPLLVFIAFLCICFTSQAQLLWNKTYGTATANQFMTRMIPLSNGGYLMVGNQGISNPVTSQTTLAICTNTHGDTIWTRKYLPVGWINIVISDAAEDYDGNLILVGSGRLASVNDYNGFILKLNPNGDTIWTKKLVTPQYDGYGSVTIGNDGNYLVCVAISGIGYLQKLDKTGNLIWSKSYMFSPTEQGGPNNPVPVGNGYFIFIHSGHITAQVRATRIDEMGNEMFSFINNAYSVNKAVIDPATNIIVCGAEKLFKLNPSGDTLWSKKYVLNTRPLNITAAKPTPDGNYITLFDRHNGNDFDIGLMKVAPNGVAIKDTVLFRFGFNEISKDIVVDANGDYVFAGHAQVAGNRTHMFLAKLRKWNHTLGLKEDREYANSIKLYPNPAIEHALVESEKLLSGELTLYNLQGQQMWQQTVVKITEKVVPLHNLPPGIYILRFVSETGTSFSRRFIKQ